MMMQQAIIRTLLILAGFWLSACGAEKNSEKRSYRQSETSNDQIPGGVPRVENPIVAEPTPEMLCNHGPNVVGTLRNPVTGKCKNWNSYCDRQELINQGYTEKSPARAGACGSQ